MGPKLIIKHVTEINQRPNDRKKIEKKVLQLGIEPGTTLVRAIWRPNKKHDDRHFFSGHVKFWPTKKLIKHGTAINQTSDRNSSNMEPKLIKYETKINKTLDQN